MVVIAVDAVSPALWFYIILSRTGKGQSKMLNLRDHDVIYLFGREEMLVSQALVSCWPLTVILLVPCLTGLAGWDPRIARWQKHLQLLLSHQDFKA